MSKLVCIPFGKIGAAERALRRLRAAHRRRVSDLRDAAVVVCDAYGEITIEHGGAMPEAGIADDGHFGVLWGPLIGLLLINPVAGLAVGNAGRASFGRLAKTVFECGISDYFVGSVGSAIRPNCSALFLLLRQTDVDGILPPVFRYQHAILRTSLSPRQEFRLRETLGVTDLGAT